MDEPLNQHPVTILASDDGEPVALHDFGGDGPPLVLAHGNGLNAGMWAAAVPALRLHHHCYGIDLRGHGACRPRDPDYSVERTRFAEDILTCIDEIGGPVDYAAHSLGAASAVYAALIRPEVFRSLWLFEPVLIPPDLKRPDGPTASPLIEAARRRRMEFDSVDDAYDRFRSKPPFSGCDPIAVRGYVELGTRPVDGGVRLSCEGVDEARVFNSGTPLEFDRLAAIDVQALVVAGAVADPAHSIPAMVATRVAEALGNASFERHDDMSHFGPMEQPAAVARSILAHTGAHQHG